MQKRLFNLMIALTMLLALIPSVAVAAPQGQLLYVTKIPFIKGQWQSHHEKCQVKVEVKENRKLLELPLFSSST